MSFDFKGFKPKDESGKKINPARKQKLVDTIGQEQADKLEEGLTSPFSGSIKLQAIEMEVANAIMGILPEIANSLEKSKGKDSRSFDSNTEAVNITLAIADRAQSAVRNIARIAGLDKEL